MPFLLLLTLIGPAWAVGSAGLNRAGLAALVQRYFDARFPPRKEGPAYFEQTDHGILGDNRIWASAPDPADAALTIGYARIGPRLICRVELGLAEDEGRLREAVFATCVEIRRPDLVGDAEAADVFTRNLRLLDATPLDLNVITRKVLSSYNGQKILRFALEVGETPVHRRARLFFREGPSARRFATESLGAAITGTATLELRRHPDAPIARVSRDVEVPLWTCERSLYVRPAFKAKLGPERELTDLIGM